MTSEKYHLVSFIPIMLNFTFLLGKRVSRPSNYDRDDIFMSKKSVPMHWFLGKLLLRSVISKYDKEFFKIFIIFLVRSFGDKEDKYLLPDKTERKLSYFEQTSLALIRSSMDLFVTRQSAFSKWAAIITKNLLKVGLSPSEKVSFVCFNESLLKIWKMLFISS